MLQLLLVTAGLAIEVVEDLEAGVDGEVAEPLHEVGGLLLEAQLEERVQREAGVAQPGEPVVPVPLAADPLGEARGRCCHDGPGGSIEEKL